MGNVMVIDQIRNVPDLHVNYVPLHIAQKFHNLKETCEARKQEGFDIRFLVVTVGEFTKSLYRIEIVENLDKQHMNVRRMAGAMLEFNDEVIAVLKKVWPKVKTYHHIQSLNFKDVRGGESLICNSICTGSFLDDYWRPRQLIRNASDYQDWVASNKAENLKHFQLIVPAPVWDELGKHLELLGFKPTYRQSVIHA